MVMLSVIVLTHNEASLIDTCLKSVVGLADEIVVVDDASGDNTVEIARQYTPYVYIEPMQSFSHQRNFGLLKVSGDWVFYLDADERVSAGLADEIKHTMASDTPRFGAWAIPRANILLGKLQQSGWWPDYQIRLFCKQALLEWRGRLHETPHFAGKLGHLKTPLIHLSHRDIYSMMQKSKLFTDQEAKLRLEAAHPTISWWRLLRVCASEFLQQIKLGRWKNGTEGWIEVLFQTFNMFIIYVRLWELQREESLPDRYKNIDQKLIKEQFDFSIKS